MTSGVLTPDGSPTRKPGAPHGQEVLDRLNRSIGQLNGVRSMYADGRYCVDVLDQIAAVRAAVDAAALLILEDHVHTCVRDAVDSGDLDGKLAELIAVMRRYLRSKR